LRRLLKIRELIRYILILILTTLHLIIAAYLTPNNSKKTPGEITVVNPMQDGSVERENTVANGYLVVDTESSKARTFQLIPQHSLTTMLQAAKLSLVTRVSDKKISDFLKTEHQKVKLLSEEFSFDGSRIISNIPLSKPMVFQKLGLGNNFSEEICCTDCFKLYPIPKLPKGQDERMPELTTTCKTVFYSESKKFLKKVGEEVQYCNAKLMDVERTGEKITKIIPIRTFTFQPLKAWLTHKLWLPGFEALLHSNLKHKNSGSGTMGDVWDGSVWKNLVGPHDSDQIFTSTPGHSVFSLYVNWFNPYGNKSGGK
jgi:hypothetical protein